jgi:hypothetical protein
MRPRGDPDALAAGARLLVVAAAELERVGRGLEDLGDGLSAAAGWSGRASAAAHGRVTMTAGEVGQGAKALRQAADGASRLAGELAAAQAAWDRAAALASSAGLVLDPGGPAGLLPRPMPWGDPRVPVAARVAEIARDASERARVADHSAAAQFTEAAAIAGRVAPSGGAVAAAATTSGATAVAGGAALAGRGGAVAGPPAAAGSGGPEASPAPEHEHERSSLLGSALAVVDRVGVAVGAGLEAVEARARALARLVSNGTEPAGSLAAVRSLATFGRPAHVDPLMAFLPLGVPVITLAANLVEGRDRGEPLLRAVVRSLGASIGAEVGQRVGIAVCGASAAATEGVGVVLCPAIAVVSSSVGASLGGTEAVRIFDALAPDPRPDGADADTDSRPKATAVPSPRAGPAPPAPAAGRRP